MQEHYQEWDNEMKRKKHWRPRDLLVFAIFPVGIAFVVVGTMSFRIHDWMVQYFAWIN
jgi:hypothetical protein